MSIIIFLCCVARHFFEQLLPNTFTRRPIFTISQHRKNLYKQYASKTIQTGRIFKGWIELVNGNRESISEILSE